MLPRNPRSVSRALYAPVSVLPVRPSAYFGQYDSITVRSKPVSGFVHACAWLGFGFGLTRKP